MTYSEPVGITAFGCERDEAERFRELAPRFGVTLTITESAVSEDDVHLASGNRCVSVGHKTRISSATLRALSRVGVSYISTRSIGYDHIDVDYAGRIGISVGNVCYSPDGVADYTVMMLLMAVRHAKSTVRRADVHDYRLHDVRGKELRDLTVGVVGTGRIGTAVMERLRAFGCRILAYGNRAGDSGDEVSLDELLRSSDVVTLHAPLNAETHHLLDRERIQRMKLGAFVVNTGRGALIDTAALVEALEDGRLGGVALDVVEGEEGVFYADRRNTPIDSKPLLRLQEMPNAFISPHTAYFTNRALSDTVEKSISNCLEFESRNQHA
ncbi:D-isomer specific 2-hydroxyacid dehydrogenase family protein [Streptomyces sp. NBC_00264]|uniref:D-isomer specific 2-hydroxyacid dehydrogenase family protein n=1 Tax=unclassified Streptomyces TaxID=2593676 RepID=UPI000F5C1CF2|nr:MULTISPECIES: D-isomer specific 2-hydroxyacid dehydrogenase family protein [unclassified Streptomyces]WSG50447.1 D-isomer specific 2-hydroxyacid dehydrogenase family protein [Streptomyces sp. NBC_01732]WSW08212.1 D-isomer specific 2-hydroxyacid dehydrogenase family protein [Streptomyces sp. NBC_01005]WSX01100.1 D-isomer specific 2-hydroxyacid dehydrogenase family protein [Streptomyces sp. NBC_00987]WTC97720.1 D-isomer specific 2-hydroxyacid dehydrogenase family protein [Streptomyces sp. NBC_